MRKDGVIITKQVEISLPESSLFETVYITSKMLEERTKELAVDISEDYKGEEIVLVCVMKGAVCFTIDLMRYITVPLIVDFITVVSYGPGATPTGVVELKKDIDTNIKGKHVLVIEDILDSGRTLSYLIEHLENKNSTSIKVCALLDKPNHRKYTIPLAYRGFVIPDIFIVGYGMDYDQRYRDLPDMGILKPNKRIKL